MSGLTLASHIVLTILPTISDCCMAWPKLPTFRFCLACTHCFDWVWWKHSVNYWGSAIYI